MNRYMRLLVFFDLPVFTAKERKEATQFRNFLIKDGFYMLQFSVYSRICNTIESAKMHEDRISKVVPKIGSVRSLIVTEKQYTSMRILVGSLKKKEKRVKSSQISFF